MVAPVEGEGESGWTVPLLLEGLPVRRGASDRPASHSLWTPGGAGGEHGAQLRIEEHARQVEGCSTPRCTGCSGESTCRRDGLAGSVGGNHVTLRGPTDCAALHARPGAAGELITFVQHHPSLS